MLALVASLMGCPVVAPVAGDGVDEDPSVDAGAEEVCDGTGSDCDRWIDEGLGCRG